MLLAVKLKLLYRPHTGSDNSEISFLWHHRLLGSEYTGLFVEVSLGGQIKYYTTSIKRVFINWKECILMFLGTQRTQILSGYSMKPNTNPNYAPRSIFHEFCLIMTLVVSASWRSWKWAEFLLQWKNLKLSENMEYVLGAVWKHRKREGAVQRDLFLFQSILRTTEYPII